MGKDLNKDKRKNSSVFWLFTAIDMVKSRRKKVRGARPRREERSQRKSADFYADFSVGEQEQD
jgi:hypothetical protein